MTLTGCDVPSSANQSSGRLISLAPIPADMRTCFVKLTGAPMPGAMDSRAIVRLIADLRKSEKAKSACGVRLLKLYDTQAKWLIEGAV